MIINLNDWHISDKTVAGYSVPKFYQHWTVACMQQKVCRVKLFFLNTVVFLRTPTITPLTPLNWKKLQKNTWVVIKLPQNVGVASCWCCRNWSLRSDTILLETLIPPPPDTQSNWSSSPNKIMDMRNIKRLIGLTHARVIFSQSEKSLIPRRRGSQKFC